MGIAPPDYAKRLIENGLALAREAERLSLPNFGGPFATPLVT